MFCGTLFLTARIGKMPFKEKAACTRQAFLNVRCKRISLRDTGGNLNLSLIFEKINYLN